MSVNLHHFSLTAGIGFFAQQALNIGDKIGDLAFTIFDGAAMGLGRFMPDFRPTSVGDVVLQTKKRGSAFFETPKGNFLIEITQDGKGRFIFKATGETFQPVIFYEEKKGEGGAIWEVKVSNYLQNIVACAQSVSYGDNRLNGEKFKALKEQFSLSGLLRKREQQVMLRLPEEKTLYFDNPYAELKAEIVLKHFYQWRKTPLEEAQSKSRDLISRVFIGYMYFSGFILSPWVNRHETQSHQSAQGMVTEGSDEQKALFLHVFKPLAHIENKTCRHVTPPRFKEIAHLSSNSEFELERGVLKTCDFLEKFRTNESENYILDSSFIDIFKKVCVLNPIKNLIPLPEIWTRFGNPFNFTFDSNTFSHVDHDSLTYSTDKLPSFLTFDQMSRTFSGKPEAQDIGDYKIVLHVHDKSDATLSANFYLSVSSAPVFRKTIDDFTIWSGTQFHYQFPIINHPMNQTFTYSATLEGGSELPNGLHFDPKTCSLSGVISTPQTLRISINVTPPSGDYYTITFSILVKSKLEEFNFYLVAVAVVSLAMRILLKRDDRSRPVINQDVETAVHEQRSKTPVVHQELEVTIVVQQELEVTIVVRELEEKPVVQQELEEKPVVQQELEETLVVHQELKETLVVQQELEEKPVVQQESQSPFILRPLTPILRLSPVLLQETEPVSPLSIEQEKPGESLMRIFEGILNFITPSTEREGIKNEAIRLSTKNPEISKVDDKTYKVAFSKVVKGYVSWGKLWKTITIPKELTIKSDFEPETKSDRRGVSLNPPIDCGWGTGKMTKFTVERISNYESNIVMEGLWPDRLSASSFFEGIKKFTYA